jgi:hypothetical protein
MKIIHKLILLKFLFLAFNSTAQNANANVTGLRADTLKKLVVFDYNLLNVDRNDSLWVELITNEGRIIRPRSVVGDIGTRLTPGLNKTVFWDAIADRQKFDEEVQVFFKIRTQFNPPSKGLVLGKKQIINLSRWTIGAGLGAYTIVKAGIILSDVNKYNKAPQPTNIEAKELSDAEGEAIKKRQQRFYPLLGITSAVLLANIAYSWVLREKAKQNNLSFTGTSTSFGISYTF